VTSEAKEPFPKARRVARALSLAACGALAAAVAAELLHAAPAFAPPAAPAATPAASGGHVGGPVDYWTLATVFMLSTFIGIGVIARVSRLLHTPLMSLTNAISAIAVVGSIMIAGEQATTLTTVLGTIAVAASVTNIVSGFLITDRMLRMFRDRGPRS
jgi:NAD(P) transhydrogenase subunit alpha